MYNQSEKIRLVIAAIAIIFFFIGHFLDIYLLRMIAKPIPLFMLISMVKRDTHYGKFIFIGLIFSVMGDVLLEASPKLFAFGLVAFLIAHINYIIAFLGRVKKASLAITAGLLLYGAGLYYVLYPSLDKLAIPVFFYVIIILAMVWRAFAQRKFDSFAIFALIGSLFFVFSDSLIAINKFYMPIDYSRGVIMATYWTAQFLIFSSAMGSAKTMSE